MSNPPHYTARMPCASPKPLPYRMLSFLMAILGGRGERQHSGGGAMCRRPAPWRIGREKVSGILVGPGKKGRKSKGKPCIGYCRIYGHYFFKPLFQALGEADIKELLFLALPAVWCEGGTPWLFSGHVFACRVK